MSVGVLYALLSSLFFSTIGVVANFLYKYSISPNLSFFSSSIISVIILFFVLLIKYKNLSFLKLNSKKDLISVSIYSGFFCLFLVNVLILFSLNYIDSGIQRILTCSSPLFVVLINYFFLKQKISKNSLISIFLMFVGLFLIFDGINIDSFYVLMGLMFAILSSIFIAVYCILTEMNNNTISDGLIYWFYGFLFSAIYSLILIFIQKDSFSSLLTNNINFFLLLLSMGIFNFLLPYIFYLKSISTIGAEKTTIISSSAIVMSMFFGFFILKESFTLLQVFGAIAIMIAVIFSAIKK